MFRPDCGRRRPNFGFQVGRCKGLHIPYQAFPWTMLDRLPQQFLLSPVICACFLAFWRIWPYLAQTCIQNHFCRPWHGPGPPEIAGNRTCIHRGQLAIKEPATRIFLFIGYGIASPVLTCSLLLAAQAIGFSCLLADVNAVQCCPLIVQVISRTFIVASFALYSVLVAGVLVV